MLQDDQKWGDGDPDPEALRDGKLGQGAAGKPSSSLLSHTLGSEREKTPPTLETKTTESEELC